MRFATWGSGVLGVAAASACGARTGLPLYDSSGGSGGNAEGGPACVHDFADCDGDPSNGCETDLGVTREHCGACGNACAPELACGGGRCVTPRTIVQVAAGSFFTCVRRAMGEVLCWGRNDYGQLGDGTTQDRMFPAPVIGLGNAEQVAAGAIVACARLAEGRAACWGANEYGAIGDGNKVRVQPSPARVMGLEGAAQIAPDWSDSCALLRNGGVSCWGNNSCGSLGDGTYVDHLTPGPVVDLLNAVDLAQECAVRSSGHVACWGIGTRGALGDGVSGLDFSKTYDPHCGLHHVTRPQSVQGIADAVAVYSMGARCVVRASGRIACWGYNEQGTIDAPGDALLPVEKKGVDGVTKVAIGYDQMCVLRTGGDVVCWGRMNGSEPKRVEEPGRRGRHRCRMAYVRVDSRRRRLLLGMEPGRTGW